MKNETGSEPLPVKHCDYLIIGGGSAGAIIARRLADADIGSVVLLEAGKCDEEDAPILDLSLLEDQGPDTGWGFLASPVRGQNQKIDYARAKMLGGCGGHNDCAFLVPPDCDFDAWESLGADGWSASRLAPYFSRVDSMVPVDRLPPVSHVSNVFLQAGIELGLTAVDFRAKITAGVGAFPLNVSGKYRQSASVAYLHPLNNLPSNLQVICNTRANKLIVKDKTVMGCLTPQMEFRASQEVILTCGSIQTPQLMMVSGIGPADQLKEFGIDVVIDIPGVGGHLIDHAAANVVYELYNPATDWQLTPCEVTMLLQVDENQPAPEILYHFVLGVRNKYIDRTDSFSNLNCIKISPNVTRPKSEGWVKLLSPDINHHPEIELNYFSDADDLDMDTIIEGIRFARKIGQTDVMKNICVSELSPGLDICSDEDIADYVRATCETVYHPAGTCRMGDIKSRNTVVDPNLKVTGLDHLRIGDASIFPGMVSVNINNTVMMVAEKAADLILADRRQAEN